MTRVRSSTRTPASGRSPDGRGRGGASPIFSIENTRQLRNRAALVVRVPFGEGARHRDNQSSFGAAAVSNVSACQPSSARCTASREYVAAEQLQHAIAMMRKIRVQPHPTPVAAAIKSGDLVPDLPRRFALDAHVALAAKFDRRVAHVDADLLLPPGTQLPQLGRGKCGCRDARLRGNADGERGGERGLGAGQRHCVERGIGLARMPPQRGKGVLGIFRKNSMARRFYRRADGGASAPDCR